MPFILAAFLSCPALGWSEEGLQCDRLFSDLIFDPLAPHARSLHLDRPVLLEEIPSYQIIGGSPQNPYAWAASLIEKKFNVPVFLQNDLAAPYFGYKGSVSTTGFDAIVLNKITSLPAERRMGVVWHEATHASVDAKFNKWNETAALRSIEFSGSVGSPEFNKLGTLYARRFRADELYAFTVQAGVYAKQAERAQIAGQAELALSSLELTRNMITQGRNFAQAIVRHYQIFEENLQNKGWISVSRESEDTVRVKTQSVTISTQNTLGPGGTIVSSDQKTYHQHSIMMHIPQSANANADKEAVIKKIGESKNDVARFLRILDAIEKRADATKQSLAPTE